MTNEITSKDIWYISIFSLLASIMSGVLFLFIIASIFAVMFFIKKEQERKREYIYLNTEKIIKEAEKLKMKK